MEKPTVKVRWRDGVEAEGIDRVYDSWILFLRTRDDGLYEGYLRALIPTHALASFSQERADWLGKQAEEVISVDDLRTQLAESGVYGDVARGKFQHLKKMEG